MTQKGEKVMKRKCNRNMIAQMGWGLSRGVSPAKARILQKRAEKRKKVMIIAIYAMIFLSFFGVCQANSGSFERYALQKGLEALAASERPDPVAGNDYVVIVEAAK